WMMTYPMQNNKWAQYFEDVSIQGNYDNNLNQYDAGMAARYLMEHPQYDASWETHVRGIITWIENIFGQQHSGATIIKEQTPVFPYAMGSHTSRYASINALLYEKTGDAAAKEKAYRSFNWATYMARSNGVVIDGLLYGSENNANQWFTDGYGDYIRHFMTGLGAVPEWSPANQTHVLRSTTVIKNIAYGINSVNYTTYDGTSTEVLHVNFNPVVTANGVLLPQRSDLTQPGWTLDINTKTLKIYHTNATQISVTAGAAIPPAISNTTICPGTNALFIMPGPGTGYTYQWQVDSTGNGFINLVSNQVHSGVATDTLQLILPPTSYYGFKYRCIATQGGSAVTGSTLTLKFSATWLGNVNTAWNNTANWSCDFLPDGFTDAIIPGSLTNYPVINSNTQVRCIITSPGSTLTINPGIRLDIKGN
ncbi:MAG TPA: hypothetical protein VI461_04545, partial [Chitinophagaceae bacterium]|nr:hypothetical protein [Chitinophagaceae bacterium]